jgi:hypothetical protein
MVDLFLGLSDTSGMLTPTKDAANRSPSATPLTPARKNAADLEFVAANQELEGFSGTISQTVANHEPNMAEIAEAARRSGAQIPTPENKGRAPLFPV